MSAVFKQRLNDSVHLMFCHCSQSFTTSISVILTVKQKPRGEKIERLRLKQSVPSFLMALCLNRIQMKKKPCLEMTTADSGKGRAVM